LTLRHPASSLKTCPEPLEAAMAPIVESIEIACTPEDVFAYLDELDRHGEWQEAIVSSKTLTDGPVRVGTRATDRRRVPGGMKVNVTYEIVEYDPPRRTRFQVINGPVRPAGTITVEPLAGGTRSRLTLELDFQGRGIGKLVAPMARGQAKKQVPADQRRLKQRLEAGA
jgi:uncharacterized membrane protein